MKSYLPNLQGPNTLKVYQKNLAVAQLVLVGGAKDLSHRGAYCLGRIQCFHPQTRKGKQIVRRATVTMMEKAFKAGTTQIENVLRDLSKIAPV